MEKKSLSSSCINDKEDTFRRKFPVLQYEEFWDYQLRLPKIKQLKQKCKKVESSEEQEVSE